MPGPPHDPANHDPANGNNASADTQQGLLFQQASSPARRIWSVRDLVSAARTALESEYVDVFVEGEVSNFRPADSGHLYFSLKDGDAQLRVVMFRSQARLLRFRPENGMSLMARGRLTIYEPRGELQLSAEFLEPMGAGALHVAFEQLKAKLAAEGLFDAARKRPLPPMPRKIGVITSPRGAAVQDIVNILQRRHSGVSVLIYPAQVQGESAPAEVAAGLRYFNQAKNVEVILIARGGGSAEDLAAFNDESLARAIAASGIPTISAVGHETDFTIADFVADLRAPTPSAAAEMVIESRQQIEERVISMGQRLIRAARYRALMARSHFTALAQHGAFARMRELLNRRQQRVDELSFRLASSQAALFQRMRGRVDIAATQVRAHDLRRIVAATRRELEGTVAQLTAAVKSRLQLRRAAFATASGRLQALSPISILERGYALVFDAAGALVKDASQVAAGDALTLRLARGTIAAEVKAAEVNKVK